jgi:hypothetical protein
VENFKDGCIACAVSHEIAKRLGIEPIRVGQAIDLLEGRIEKCQLGLFGYGTPKKIAKAGESVDSALRTRILSAAADGRLTCAEAWRIAATAGITRLAMGNACETVGVKVIQCQLGAF